MKKNLRKNYSQLKVSLPKNPVYAIIAASVVETALKYGPWSSVRISECEDELVTISPLLSELEKSWHNLLSTKPETRSFGSSEYSVQFQPLTTKQLSQLPQWMSSVAQHYWVNHFENSTDSLRTIEPEPCRSIVSHNELATHHAATCVIDCAILKERWDGTLENFFKTIAKEYRSILFVGNLEEREDILLHTKEFLSSLIAVEICSIEELISSHNFSSDSIGVVRSSSLLGHVLTLQGLHCLVLDSEVRAEQVCQPVSSLARKCNIQDLQQSNSITDLVSSVHPQPKRNSISAFVICKNEEKNIERCLQSISWCDEIVLVDSGSTDRTLELAEPYGVRLFEREWSGHRDQKEFALFQCTSDWVINLDADEELSWQAREEIILKLREDVQKTLLVDGFELNRVMWFLGIWWLKGGWYPEYRLRLIRREKAQWGGEEPHEKALVSGKTGKLKGYLFHYSFEDLFQYVSTMNRFSTISVSSKKSIRNVFLPWFTIPVRSLSRFMKFYILRRGFLHGFRGLIVAIIEGFYTFLKYSKKWEAANVPFSEQYLAHNRVLKSKSHALPAKDVIKRKRFRILSTKL